MTDAERIYHNGVPCRNVDYDGKCACGYGRFSPILKYSIILATLLASFAFYEVAFGVYCGDLGTIYESEWDTFEIDVSECSFAPDNGTFYWVATQEYSDVELCTGYVGNVYLSGDPGYVNYTKPDNLGDWLSWSQATSNGTNLSVCLNLRGQSPFTQYIYGMTLIEGEAPTPTPSPSPSTIVPVLVSGDCGFSYSSPSGQLASSSCEYDVSEVTGSMSVLGMALMIGLFLYGLSVGHHILSHV